MAVVIHIQGAVDHYDTEGKGGTWPEALASYAADCRRAASTYQHTVELLLDEARLADAMAAAAAEQLAP